VEIRKRIEEKIKNGYNMDKPGGLKAKAEQLRRENELRERTAFQPTEEEKRSALSTEHNTSMNEDLRIRVRNKPDNGKSKENISNKADNSSKAKMSS
jgi:hypothetical protein